MVRATWVPGWYGLDQPLAVGLTDEFAFWRILPEDLRGAPEGLVFYNTLWKPDDALMGNGTIMAISNPELGEIREVDTRPSLDYAIRLADGTTLQVDAEEEPGRLYEGSTWSSRVVNDWGLAVEFDALSELHPPPPLPLWRGRELQTRRRWGQARRRR
jgi:hypothetical protein